MTDTPPGTDDRIFHDNPIPSSDSEHHVHVAAAESQFIQLQRALSARTRRSSSEDVEKGDLPAAGFDLRAYLTSSNDEAERAGLAHKHVGVTWENLQVVGIGGDGHKVCHIRTCLSHIQRRLIIFVIERSTQRRLAVCSLLHLVNTCIISCHNRGCSQYLARSVPVLSVLSRESCSCLEARAPAHYDPQTVRREFSYGI